MNSQLALPRCETVFALANNSMCQLLSLLRGSGTCAGICAQSTVAGAKLIEFSVDSSLGSLTVCIIKEGAQQFTDLLLSSNRSLVRAFLDDLVQPLLDRLNKYTSKQWQLGEIDHTLAIEECPQIALSGLDMLALPLPCALRAYRVADRQAWLDVLAQLDRRALRSLPGQPCTLTFALDARTQNLDDVKRGDVFLISHLSERTPSPAQIVTATELSCRIQLSQTFLKQVLAMSSAFKHSSVVASEISPTEARAHESNPRREIPSNCHVRLQGVQITVGQLTDLAPDYVIDTMLPTSDLRFEVVANARVVAIGQAMQLGDTLGIRIIETIALE